jgi:hypothetical protein
MTLFSSTDLLADFDFFANRTSNDASLTDAQKYRLLTLAQQEVAKGVATAFPRFLMGAPALMTTSDGGLTYAINGTDEDGLTIRPFGHAEVYLKLPSGRELYGSTYAGGVGDVVFEGGVIRLPRMVEKVYDGGPYIRYVAMPGTLNASTAPTLPSVLRPLIVYRALVLWANRGGLRDPRPFEDMYGQAWSGAGRPGDYGIVGLIGTQYKNGLDGALAGQAWWRSWMATSALGVGVNA